MMNRVKLWRLKAARGTTSAADDASVSVDSETSAESESSATGSPMDLPI